MPWSDRSLEHVAEYEACIGCLQGIIDRHIRCQFLFGGDLNVSKHSSDVCSLHIRQFAETNGMFWLDILDGECHYTYHNDVNVHYSLLDYFLVSPSIVNDCQSVAVLNDGDNPSDHLAISCTINVTIGNTKLPDVDTNSHHQNNIRLNWNVADTNLYATTVSELLADVDIPTDTLLCRGALLTMLPILKNITVTLSAVYIPLPIVVYHLLKQAFKNIGGHLNWTS